MQRDGAGTIGIVVDELLGQQQVVVKSLEANYDAVDGISGATILGNGRVALILDVTHLREIDDGPGGSLKPQPPAKTIEVQEDMTHAA